MPEKNVFQQKTIGSVERQYHGSVNFPYNNHYKKHNSINKRGEVQGGKHLFYNI